MPEQRTSPATAGSAELVQSLIQRWAESLERTLRSAIPGDLCVEWSRPRADAPRGTSRAWTWMEQELPGCVAPRLSVGIADSTVDQLSAWLPELEGTSRDGLREWLIQVLSECGADLSGPDLPCGELEPRVGAPEQSTLHAVTITGEPGSLPPLLVAFAEPFQNQLHSLAGAAAEDSGTSCIQTTRATASSGSSFASPASGAGCSPASSTHTTGAPAQASAPRAADEGHSRTLDADPRTIQMMLEFEMPIRIAMGKASVPLRDVLKMTTGSVLELNRTLEEPVDVLVNNCPVAKGEIVVIDGNYGIRILQINDRARKEASLVQLRGR